MGNTFSGEKQENVTNRLEINIAELSEHCLRNDKEESKVWVEQIVVKKLQDRGMTREQGLRKYKEEIEPLLMKKIEEETTKKLEEFKKAQVEDRFESLGKLQNQSIKDLQNHRAEVEVKFEKQTAEFEKLRTTVKQQDEKLNSVDQDMQKTKEKLATLEMEVEKAKEERKTSENKLNEVKAKIEYQQTKMKHEMDPRTRKAIRNKRSHEKEMEKERSDRMSRIMEMKQKLTPDQFDRALIFLTMEKQNDEQVGVEELDREPDTEQLNLSELDRFADTSGSQHGKGKNFTAPIIQL